MSEQRLNEALNALRGETAAAAEVAAAKARVWAKLQADSKPANPVCAGVQAELEGYRAGTLNEQKRTLVADHLSRCTACRNVYAEMKGERKLVVMPQARKRGMAAWQQWAVAAGIGALMLYAGRERIDDLMAPGGARATVIQVAGEMHRLPEGLLQKGATLSEGEVVRTAPGTRAVLQLADGSKVEVNERSQFYIHTAWSGQTIQLERGDVIVEAAKQRRGHLKVKTKDAEVAVKGTVFAVSSGMAGSVVTVMEGSVQVNQRGSERLLKPGEQSVTSAALAEVTPAKAVSWSAEQEKYAGMLNEFAQFGQKLTNARVLRTDPRLVGYLPRNTVAYGAGPNLGENLKDALAFAEQRAKENAAFGEFWNGETGAKVREMLAQVQKVTPLIGGEIAYALVERNGSKVPVVYAEYAQAKQGELESALQPLMMGGSGFIARNGVVLMTTSKETASWVQSEMGTGATSEFAAEIAQHYKRGTGWLFGLRLGAGESKAPALVSDTHMKSVFFEQRTLSGSEQNEATLNFGGARSGVASWLAAAGSTGAAEYVSAESVLAFSGTVKEPKQLFDEMTQAMGQVQPGVPNGLKEFEEATGVDVGNDIAAALGTDFAVSLESPTIPVPGVLVTLEVYRPGVLEASVKKLVEAYNAKAADAAKKLTLTVETKDGRSWTTLGMAGAPFTLTWTYDRGYLVMSNERAIALRAIQTRSNGFPLVTSAAFQKALPAGSPVHPSGFLWVNVNEALQPVVQLVDSPLLKKLTASREPILVVVNGETERIRIASRTGLTSLVIDGMMAGAAGHSKVNMVTNGRSH